jgi:hypothetical protein
MIEVVMKLNLSSPPSRGQATICGDKEVNVERDIGITCN